MRQPSAFLPKPPTTYATSSSGAPQFLPSGIRNSVVFILFCTPTAHGQVSLLRRVMWVHRRRCNGSGQIHHTGPGQATRRLYLFPVSRDSSRELRNARRSDSSFHAPYFCFDSSLTNDGCRTIIILGAAQPQRAAWVEIRRLGFLGRQFSATYEKLTWSNSISLVSGFNIWLL